MSRPVQWQAVLPALLLVILRAWPLSAVENITFADDGGLDERSFSEIENMANAAMERGDLDSAQTLIDVLKRKRHEEDPPQKKPAVENMTEPQNVTNLHWEAQKPGRTAVSREDFVKKMTERPNKSTEDNTTERTTKSTATERPREDLDREARKVIDSIGEWSLSAVHERPKISTEESMTERPKKSTVQKMTEMPNNTTVQNLAASPRRNSANLGRVDLDPEAQKLIDVLSLAVKNLSKVDNLTPRQLQYRRSVVPDEDEEEHEEPGVSSEPEDENGDEEEEEEEEEEEVMWMPEPGHAQSKEKIKRLAEASDVDVVSLFNKLTFNGNVLEGTGDVVDSWIVFFGVQWYEPSELFFPVFRNASVHWEEELNADALLKSQVRFAWVDCATDKVLCNQQSVRNYPQVNHYRAGRLSKTWISGYQSLADDKKRFVKWVAKQLTIPEKAAPSFFESFEEEEQPGMYFRCLVSLTVFIVGNIWYVGHVAEFWPTSRSGWAAAASRGWRPAGSEHASVASADDSKHAFLPDEWAVQCTSIEL